MAGGMIAGAGLAAGCHASQMRKNAKELADKVEEMKQKWNAVMKSEGKVTSQLSDEYVKILDTINTIQAKIKINHQDFQKNFKTVQYTGVVFIIIIFFLLLLKQYKLLGPLFSLIFYPFTYVFVTLYKQAT